MKPSSSPRGLLRAAVISAAAVPLLATWFAIGGCSEGRSGVTMVLHAMGYSVTASYCHL